MLSNIRYIRTEFTLTSYLILILTGHLVFYESDKHKNISKVKLYLLLTMCVIIIKNKNLNRAGGLKINTLHSLNIRSMSTSQTVGQH